MPEPFGIGREIVSEFNREAGSLMYSEIVGRKFCDLADFKASFLGSKKCRETIELASDIASRIIERWRR